MKAGDGRKTKSKGRRIYDAVTGTLCVLIFLFLTAVLAFIIWQRTSGEKDVKLFGYYMFDVLSDSMQPAIMKSDVILGKETDADALKVGDVITFAAPSGMLKGHNVTHRIIEIVRGADGGAEYIVTKGDNAPDKDPWKLSPNAVKSVYVKTLPGVGALRSFMTTPAGYAVLIVLPLTAVFCMIAAGAVQTYVKDKREKSASAVRPYDSLSDEEKMCIAKEYLKENGIKRPTDGGDADGGDTAE